MADRISWRECSKKHSLSLSEWFARLPEAAFSLRCHFGEGGSSESDPQQGRSLFDARSVHSVRERERREERQVCEPEGRQKGENAAGGFFQHSHHVREL